MENQDKNEIPYLEGFKSIDLGGMIRKLMDEYKVILKWCGIAVILALIVGFSVPKKFTVVSRMSLESSSGGVSTGGGTLSSLAGIAGINLGSLTNSGDVMSPELYPEILTSTPFVLELFPKTVEFEDRKGEHTITFYEYVKDYMKKPWWNAVVHFPMKALGWVVGLFQPKKDKEKEDEILDFTSIDLSHLTMEQFAVAGEIRRNIAWSVDKKSSVIRLSVAAQNPDVAMQISGDVIKLLQDYLIEYRTEKARRDLDYYQQLFDEAKTDYYKAQQRYADFQDRNQSVITQRGRAEQDRLKNEMSLSYSLYTSCSQQVQAAKAKVQLDTPVFNVIDPPQYPFIGKPRKVILIAAFVLVGAILSALWILWGRGAIASLRRKDKEEPVPAPEEDSQA